MRGRRRDQGVDVVRLGGEARDQADHRPGDAGRVQPAMEGEALVAQGVDQGSGIATNSSLASTGWTSSSPGSAWRPAANRPAMALACAA